MTDGLFRILLSSGEIRLARGRVDLGRPAELLEAGPSISRLLRAGPDALAAALAGPTVGAVPDDVTVLAPVDAQEIWAAGVTYERSREARLDEATEPSIYERVYDAVRPELFLKAPAWRTVGTLEPIGIRADSAWNVPEPELAIVATPALEPAGFMIANDVSSRSIEGENPLYLPQAKIYDRSCALGPAIVPASQVKLPLDVRLLVTRGDVVVVDEATSTSRMHRSIPELLGALGAALAQPDGVVLLTGTGIVPPSDFTLLPGDIVRIEIDGLGVLENPVISIGRARADQGEPAIR